MTATPTVPMTMTFVNGTMIGSANKPISEVKISNKLVSVVLQLPHVEEGESLTADDVIEIEKTVNKTDGLMIELDKAQVQAFLDSTRAVVGKERAELKCSTDSGKVKMRVATANGNSSEVMKSSVKKAQKFNVDLEYFDEAVRKSKTVGFKLVENEFLVFNTGSESKIVVSLNQDSDGGDSYLRAKSAGVA